MTTGLGVFFFSFNAFTEFRNKLKEKKMKIMNVIHCEEEKESVCVCVYVFCGTIQIHRSGTFSLGLNQWHSAGHIIQ